MFSVLRLGMLIVGKNPLSNWSYTVVPNFFRLPITSFFFLAMLAFFFCSKLLHTLQQFINIRKLLSSG